MIGRLNHVAIAVPQLAAAVAQYRGTLGAEVSEPLPQPEHGVTVVFVTLAQHQDRAAGAAGREVADRGLPGAQPGGRHPSLCYEVADILRRARQAARRPARACSATASPGSARTASRCCSCTPRISTARWSSSSRPERSMSVPFAIAIYVVIWWTVLFAVLPIGVRTQGEDGVVVPGTPESAPTRAALAARRAPDHAGLGSGVRRALGGDQVRHRSIWSNWLGRRVDARRRNEKSKAARPCSRDCRSLFSDYRTRSSDGAYSGIPSPDLGSEAPCTTSGLMTFFIARTLAKPRPSVTP